MNSVEMQNKSYTKQQLLNQLEVLCQQNADLESYISRHKQIEEELQSNRDYFKRLNDSLGEAILIVNNRTETIEYTNQVFEKILGYTSQDCINKGIKFLFPDDGTYSSFTRAIHNALTKQKDILKTENQLKAKSGDIFIAEITTTFFKISDLDTKTISIIRDVTEHKIEKDILKLEAQLLDSVNDPVLVRDMKGDFVYVNEMACKSLGYSREELMSMNLGQIVNPEYSLNIKERTQEILARGQRNLEAVNIRKDGTKTFSEIHARVIESEGEMYILSIMHDITERKKTEEEFRAHLLDCAGEPIVLYDLEGKFYYLNEAAVKLHGYQREEMINLKIDHLLPMKQPLADSYRHELLERGQQTYEGFGSRKDGSTFPVEVHSCIIETPDQKLIFSIYRDVTQHKRAEEEREHLLNDLKKFNSKLEESNKELQDFAYIASHDLREPLRKIASFGNILESSLAGKLNEDDKENFAFMIDGANRMQNMIESLLTYSRVTTKAKPFVQVDLNKVIEDVTKLELSIRLEETKGIIRVPEPLPFIYGDQEQIRQLFHNLIHNGLKFHRDGIPPEILVLSQQIENNMVLIKIQDNGIGIDELYFDQLFNMFKRLNTRAQFEGSGIGLAVCKKIVKRHGGEIGIESKTGQGSTFWFTLPGASYVRN